MLVTTQWHTYGFFFFMCVRVYMCYVVVCGMSLSTQMYIYKRETEKHQNYSMNVLIIIITFHILLHQGLIYIGEEGVLYYTRVKVGYYAYAMTLFIHSRIRYT